MSLLSRLTSPGPKRILALDGGGIRGTLALGFLGRIEHLLSERFGDPDLRLCDYFDLIGGTSSGAIVATLLALGLRVDEIKTKYLELGGRIFGKKKWKVWEARFDAGPLEEEARRFFGDTPLGDASIRTGLCIVTKRADTRSTWPLLNHPRGRYYDANRHITLCQAIRASTAAPGYFVPQTLDLGEGQVGTFLDGGLSMANNPALLLFLVATLRGFPFRWSTGKDRLLLVSVGTGFGRTQEDPEELAHGKIWDWASLVPELFAEDASWQNQLLLQYLSRSPTPWSIDSEVGDLSEDLLTPEPALFYLRYDVPIETDALEELGLPELAPRAEALRDMSAAANRFDLARIGERAAARVVAAAHFPPAFDPGAGA